MAQPACKEAQLQADPLPELRRAAETLATLIRSKAPAVPQHGMLAEALFELLAHDVIEIGPGFHDR